MAVNYPTPQELQQLLGYNPMQPPADPYGLSSAYEGAPSYIPTAAVPQPQLPSEVQQLISGQGFDPATLAAMRAGAIEDVSNAALPQMGQLTRGLSAAGLTNSPAAAAYKANLGRQTGDKQASELQQIGIANAMQGQQNRLSGLNLAHSYAMENANRLFEAMGQNLSQSGANIRQATSTLMGQQPYNPGAGQPRISGVGPAITGAASNINWGSVFGGGQQQPTANNPPVGATPPFVAPDAFAKNPFKGG